MQFEENLFKCSSWQAEEISIHYSFGGKMCRVEGRWKKGQSETECLSAFTTSSHLICLSLPSIIATGQFHESVASPVDIPQLHRCWTETAPPQSSSHDDQVNAGKSSHVVHALFFPRSWCGHFQLQFWIFGAGNIQCSISFSEWHLILGFWHSFLKRRE